MARRYPIMLDLRDRQIVVIGGGAVATRKVSRLRQAGATRIRVVAPAFHPSMPDGIERIAAPYADHHLNTAALVFATTDSAEVNDAVVRDARSRGIWVNRADAGDTDAAAGDFAVPSFFEDGPLIVSVATGSPALSRRIRRQLAERIDPHLAAFAAVLTQLRPMVRNDRDLSADQRREILLWLSGDAAIDAFERGGVEDLMIEARTACPAWKPSTLAEGTVSMPS